MRWWKSKQPASPVVIIDPTLRSFRLSLAGGNEQIVTDCEGDVRLYAEIGKGWAGANRQVNPQNLLP